MRDGLTLSVRDIATCPREQTEHDDAQLCAPHQLRHR